MDEGRKDEMEGHGEEGRLSVRQKWTEGGVESGTERGRNEKEQVMYGVMVLLQALSFYD